MTNEKIVHENFIPYKKISYQPAKGYVENPFSKYPRNFKCFCESGRKFKVCCEPKTPSTIPSMMLERTKSDFSNAMKKGADQKNIEREIK